MKMTFKPLPVIVRAVEHADRPAIATDRGVTTYRDLVRKAHGLGTHLLADQSDLGEARIGLGTPAAVDLVSGLWGVWQAGGVAVPLSMAATTRETSALLEDTAAAVVVISAETPPPIIEACRQRSVPTLAIDASGAPEADTAWPAVSPDRRAMILFTSGTTSRPKGVVTTHRTIQAQIESLVAAWQWSENDSVPLFLPLHHIHGLINVVSCCLWAGGRIDALPRFDIRPVIDAVQASRYTVFMAVPTIYHRLITHLESLGPPEREMVAACFARLRLMVSGSAALPASMHDRWAELTGQRLLERYGMTEIGMALSNPYVGERRPGAVGVPLPGVEVRLVNEAGEPIGEENTAGEIEVRGPTVFREYWNRPEATAEAFRGDWFRTGDMAVIERGSYRILGRTSTDIIKSGGYKLSALEIEAVLLEHPAIAECAVVGVPDEAWGEAVAAAVVRHQGNEATGQENQLTLDGLRHWCRDRLSHYRIPRRLLVCDALPRNPLGKVVKPAVTDLFTRVISGKKP